MVRLGTGVPAMYNDETIIPALCNRGVSLADARNYGMIGCVEPQSPHKTDGWHDSAFVNVAKNTGAYIKWRKEQRTPGGAGYGRCYVVQEY